MRHREYAACTIVNLQKRSEFEYKKIKAETHSECPGCGTGGKRDSNSDE